jgi:N-methylhydantoinase A
LTVAYAVGVDVGGTFTDLVAIDQDDGRLMISKVPSTPPTFVEGVMNALARAGLEGSDLGILRHGSTITTNAIIERRGPRTALVTTKGMRDILTAARSNRPDLFDLRWTPPPHLARRRDILTVEERIDYEGEELTPLNEDDMRSAGATLARRDVGAVGICFLNSFMNPSHELRAKEILLEACPEAYICTSFEILPEIREFERSSTVVVNAFLGPIIRTYLESLIGSLRQWGYGGEVLIAHSGGGVMSVEAAQRFPVRVCQSGPAAGAMGGAFLGRVAGYENLITLDMGGTSADIALAMDGRPLTSAEWRLEFTIPIVVPAVDLQGIGAGGGTIAWVDAAGILRNGPKSAGADPGPACYGKGGDEPTNTDAQVVLGRLRPDAFLGGEMLLDPDLAYRAIEGRIARPMGMAVEEAADGMLHVANANMTDALRLVTVRHGRDPRDFALVAFGGAGPLHAAELASQASISRIIVPRYPGIASALGTLHVDYRHDLLRSVLKRDTDVDSSQLQSLFDELEREAAALLEGEGVPPESRKLERVLDMRYYGQSPYLQIPVPESTLEVDAVSRLVAAFNQAHLREAGYVMPREITEVEIVNARVIALGLTETPELAPEGGAGTAGDAYAGSRPVFFHDAGKFVDTAAYDRNQLRPTAIVEGPAIIEQLDSTTLIPPGWTAEVDRYLNLVLSRG